MYNERKSQTSKHEITQNNILNSVKTNIFL